MSDSNRRDFFRALITVPVRWRVLTPEEVRRVKQGQGHTLYSKRGIPSPIDEFIEEATPGSQEERLYRCLQLLNNKLDFVIEQIFHHSSGTPPSRDDVIDMSASGLKFTCREHLQKGALLKMDLVMPGTFQFQTELLAEVVRVEAKEGGYIVAVRIVEIDEGSRESIVKTVFQKQRMDIRGGKVNREDQDGH
jgi:hypothetical protein